MIPVLWSETLKAFWISFAVAALGSPLVMRLLAAAKSRQTVSQYAPEAHQLKQGTPTMGGLIILLGFFGWFAWAAIDPLHPKIFLQLRGLLMVTAGFTVIGFVDDYVVPRWLKGKRGLGWKQKIVAQFAVAAVAVVYGFPGDFGWTQGIGIFLILFYSNAFNFSDGLDGLAGSIFLALVVGLGGLCFVTPWTWTYLIPLAALAGGMIPFLYWNAPPAKVFMGDVGSLPIGALLGYIVAALAVPSDPVASEAVLVTGFVGPIGLPDDIFRYVALFILSGVMLIELVPVPLQILSVKLRKKRLFLYTPIHHAFEKIGWRETRIVAAFALLQLLLSVASLTVMAQFSNPRPLKHHYYHYYFSPEND